MNDAYIALGSNWGTVVANVRAAVLALDDLPGTEVVYVSHLYESEPWGVTDQAPFGNAVVMARSTLRADQLLDYLKDVEGRMGRTSGPRFGPRIIDLDLLLLGDEEWETDDLVVPHPRMGERDFVLTPLLAIAPHVTWPDGRLVRKEGSLTGRVIADRGRIPDLDPDWYVWEARDATYMEAPYADGAVPGWDPIDAWVEVAVGSAHGMEIDVLESKLRAADIPYELSHREMGDNIGFLGGPASILVPESHAEEARSVLGFRGSRVPTRAQGPRPERPAWFRGTLRVFSWMFAAYWILRLGTTLVRDWTSP